MGLLFRSGTAVLLFLYVLRSVSGRYVVTWPKSWFIGRPAKFCFALDKVASWGDSITVQVLVESGTNFEPEVFRNYSYRDFSYPGVTAYLPQEVIDRLNLMPDTKAVILEEVLTPVFGTKHSCVSMMVPEIGNHWRAEVQVSGTLVGTRIDKSRFVSIGTVRTWNYTFIQTDKVKYKPGQKVQFRVLTLQVPDLRVITVPYSTIYVQDPSGTRIQQWLDVANLRGLIHLDFQLYDEPQEGLYTIYVESATLNTGNFFVEKYVLPRFEVTVNSPGYVLASADTLELEVCAQYTFGQPVSGTVAVNINNGRYGNNEREENFVGELVGCESVEISLSSLRINYDYDPAYVLIVAIEVEEEGTGVVVRESLTLDISRTALYFQQYFRKYPRPELPAFIHVRASFTDGKPAKREPLTVCTRRWVLPAEAQRARQASGCITAPPSLNQASPMTVCPEIVCKYVGTNKFGIPVTTCFMALCRNMTTDDSGILRVTVPPHLFNDPLVEAGLEVRAVNYPAFFSENNTRQYMWESTTQLYLDRKPYFSPSNSSLCINPYTPEINCTPGSIQLQLPVMYASRGAAQVTLYVQAVSRGQIQLWKTFNVLLGGSKLEFDDATLVEQMEPPASLSTRRGMFTLPLTLTSTDSTSVRVLIWYIRPDGEVVSDEQELYLSQYCLKYPVELSWPIKRVEVGSKLPLTLTAEPNSLCSVGVVDKSVELLSSTQNTQQLFIDIISSLATSSFYIQQDSQVDDLAHCVAHSCEADLRRGLNPTSARNTKSVKGDVSEEKPDLRMLGVDPTSTRSSVTFYTKHVDAIQIFDDAGVIVISDQTLETRPCTAERSGSCNYYSGIGGLPNGGLLGGLLGGAGGGLLGGAGGGLLGGAGGGLQSAAGGGQSLGAASGEQANGIDPSLSAGPLPAVGVGTRVYFPETWLWELQTIPYNGVYSENRTLPDTITEWVGKAVCVHPDKGLGISAPTSITTFSPFFIDLTLPPSVKVGEILPVKISVFNYLNTALPVHVILGKSSEYEILKANSTEAAADQAVAGGRSVCVSTQDKETVVVRIRLRVAGSVSLNVTAAVDTAYAGPCGSGAAVNKIDRISKPIDVDYAGFARETTWTKYICSTDARKINWYLEAPAGIVNNSIRAWVTVAGDLLGLTLDNLDHLINMPYGCGEQNMITFTPNIFVLQYLLASNQANNELIGRLRTYMSSGYQRQLRYKRNDGSYSAFGNSDASGSTWLTAFVLKSFVQSSPYIVVDDSELTASSNFLKQLQLTSGCFKSVGTVIHKSMKGGVGDNETPSTLTAYVMAALLEAGVNPSATAIVNATSCIDAATAPGSAEKDDVYLLALKAYAYSLAGLPKTQAIINDLLNRSIHTTDGIFWDMNSLNGLYNDALSVETASYVLLAMIKSNMTDPEGKSMLIAKWITSRRNGQGGFVSTQDTVVALQALALFAAPGAQNQLLNLNVTITEESRNVVFQVTGRNRLLTQRTDVDVVPGNVTVDLKGSGCAVVQAVIRYNVPNPDVGDVFTLRVSSSIDYRTIPYCTAYTINICATYLLNDGESNMGIVEVNLVSGYVPNIEDLKRIIRDVTSSFKRYEIENGKVFLYIDQFTNTETCVEFTAFQEVKVEDVKPGTVKIYDYYEPNFFASETFTFSRRFC